MGFDSLLTKLSGFLSSVTINMDFEFTFGHEKLSQKSQIRNRKEVSLQFDEAYGSSKHFNTRYYKL